ncbi:hypothetical protein [Bradyrhizobium liaoningense]
MALICMGGYGVGRDDVFVEHAYDIVSDVRVSIGRELAPQIRTVA